MMTGATTLGPQCLKCRKRRVKCDSAKPRCDRCRRDNFECPGYVDRHTKWMIATPANISGAIKPRSKACSHKPASPVTSTTSSDVPNNDTALSPICLTLPGHLALPDDLICYQFNDALAYWTKTVHPSLPCSPLTGPARNISQEDWVGLPRIMLHSIVSTIASVRLVRDRQDNPDTQVIAQVRMHRGRALELLRLYLADLQRLRSKGLHEQVLGWSALVLVISVMTNEFSMTATGDTWALHLSAAWTLVELQGGFPQHGEQSLDVRRLAALDPIWSSGFQPERVCSWVLQVEVFSATTCPVWALERREDVMQAFQDDGIEDLEDRLLSTICPCPLAILRALAEINDLRLELHTLADHAHQTTFNDAVVNLSTRLWDTLTDLISFDAAAWAHRLYQRHPPESHSLNNDDPSAFRTMWLLSWIILATCYRSAAILYLIHAFQPNHPHHSPAAALFYSACPPIMVLQHSDAAKLLATHRRALAEGLAILMRDYDENDPNNSTASSLPNRTELECLRAIDTDAHATSMKSPMPNLWRYLSWPLFINAYEVVAWSGDDDEEQQQQQEQGYEARAAAKTARLARMGRAIGASCLVDAADLLDGVRAKRRKLWIREGVWRWDDAFAKRCIFAV